MAAYIHAFLTGTRVTFHADGSDHSEAHGYVDPTWNRFEFAESRNDAGSLLSSDERDDDLSDRVQEALNTHLGSYADNGDGTFYGQGEHVDQDGNAWTYAVHFVRKTAGDGITGVETAWLPADHGIILGTTQSETEHAAHFNYGDDHDRELI